ncbi:MAG: RNA methyltransferase [Clostridiales bacterium]|nr:RNA methyltransferase [Clostridiales bacterium]
MISSMANPAVKALVRLQKQAKERRRQELFIVEGIRGVGEAPEERIERIYVSESFLSQISAENPSVGQTGTDQGNDTAELLAGRDYEILSDSVFSHVSDTQTPQGIMAVVRMRKCLVEEIFSGDNGLWLVLENIQDPGNLGTMFRTAEGAGVSGIIMDGSTVDVYNPKTVRSTMGSIFRVPFMITEDLPATVDEMNTWWGITTYAACAGAALSYSAADFTRSSAFLIGNEGNGLTQEIQAKADKKIFIPMRGALESLNASMAAGILMYEADRQRRCGG